MLVIPRVTPTVRNLPLSHHLRRSTPSSYHLWHRRHSSSSTPSSIESPSYPGLYYHPIGSTSPQAYSLSFHPTPAPSLNFSPTTIGTLHSTGSTGTSSSSSSDLPEPNPRHFDDNPEFSQVLQEILKEVIASEGNKVLETMAKTRPEDGWIVSPSSAEFDAIKQGEGDKEGQLSDSLHHLRSCNFLQHITDQRTQIDVLSRVPDPSDIIASLLVQNGEIIPDSYQPSGTHRLVTIDGMMKLERELFRAVRVRLARVRDVEEEIARGAQK
ncbi:BQ2448_5035 [Microbotryum intermedium]|uniref:BQ2448_5035 protein n=1 Tax=Microbotryum intermedium TaxID=269621 RepID=A0A238F6F4_9BASI|nr:BQ2448_5035 [Microbotryum intermedium]